MKALLGTGLGRDRVGLLTAPSARLQRVGNEKMQIDSGVPCRYATQRPARAYRVLDTRGPVHLASAEASRLPCCCERPAIIWDLDHADERATAAPPSGPAADITSSTGVGPPGLDVGSQRGSLRLWLSYQALSQPSQLDGRPRVLDVTQPTLPPHRRTTIVAASEQVTEVVDRVIDAAPGWQRNTRLLRSSLRAEQPRRPRATLADPPGRSTLLRDLRAGIAHHVITSEHAALPTKAAAPPFFVRVGVREG